MDFLFKRKWLFQPVLRLLGWHGIRYVIVLFLVASLVLFVRLPVALTILLLLLALYVLITLYIVLACRNNRERQKIIVQVKSGAVPALKPGRLSRSELRRIFPGWQQLTARSGTAYASTVFGQDELSILDRIQDQAARREPSYRRFDFKNLINVYFSPTADVHRIAAGLRGLAAISKVHVDPLHIPTGSSVAADQEPLFDHQRYLNPPPEGIGAKSVWGVEPGADGEGTSFVDVEDAWFLDSDELKKSDGTPFLTGTVFGDLHTTGGDDIHGFEVLSVLMAQENGIGGVGIAHRVARPSICGFRYVDGRDKISVALVYAIASIPENEGGIIVLPVACLLAAGDVPVEAEPVCFKLIQLACASGRIVVQAAGNGSMIAPLDLNTWRDPEYKVLDPEDPNFEDSFAIVAGAATTQSTFNPGPPQTLTPSTGTDMHFPIFTRGRRVDCYAWGENVLTTHTKPFDGTSAATAIIAGAALSVQGAAKKLGRTVSALEMRRLLKHGACPARDLGNPAAQTNDVIGGMPDLAAIIGYLKNPPTVTIRQGLAGGALSRAAPDVFVSPDIIVRQQPVANPDTTFGEQSGHQDDEDLSDPFVAGQTHSIYFRVRNSGAAPGAVKAILFTAPVATLFDSKMLSRVGETDIKGIPAGNTFVVSPPIGLSSANLPVLNWPGSAPSGALLVMIDSPDKPAVHRSYFSSRRSFTRLMQFRTNFALRNLHIVLNAPSTAVPMLPAPEYVGLPVKVPTVESAVEAEDGCVELAFHHDLPAGGALWLEGPLVLFTAAGEPPDIDDGTVAWIDVSSKARLSRWSFQAPQILDLRLLALVPAASRAQTFTVRLDQVDGNQVLGSCTWMLKP